MRHFKLTLLIFGILFLSCSQPDKKKTSVTKEKASTSTNNKEEIRNLIREVLNWAESKNSIDLLPTISDSKDSIYIGFDLEKHKQNLDKLCKTNFFATEFIDNYDQIILTLDKGLRNGKYNQWLIADLPPFTFANDVDPWTMCQHVPYDNPNPYDFIEINIVDPDTGEINWKWRKLEPNMDASWKDFSYKFRVKKENDQWKISYLQGFNFKESTSKDGELK